MKPTRSLLLSCLLVIAAGHSVAASNNRRQGPGGIIPTTLPPPTPPTTTSPPPTPPTTTHSDTEPAPDTNTSRSTQSTPPTPTPSTDPPPPDTQTRPPSTTQQQPPTPTPTPSPPPQQITPTPTPSEVTSTDAQGGTVIVTVTNPPTSSSSSAAAPSQSAKNDDDDDSPALGTGSIVAISVAGGVAVIALGAFLVWKFTRKRFADFDDSTYIYPLISSFAHRKISDEAIKWPDLNTHGGTADSHPLPVNSTGRAGFETGSEASLSRVPSSSYSTPDLAGGAQDPYAVPPLPHMNPNQPYRDDPTAATGYYDPYRGPVPGTLEHGASADDWAGEAIPMTQMAGRVSPGPQAAYGAANASSVGHGEYAQDYGHESYDVGRRSPGPQAAYGIQAGGRTGSPGPQAAYAAGGGRASPGPQAAYSTGRMSPGPQASYDQYGVPR
ncbi:hypothetical protein DXG03_000441 [Asterophora parasitica]|uniref:Uncharacterized protein n=1 Tax=Asterophora parasitica TaxID=117018 RepID=A0A9P7GEU4_9AGAR|nr:hypothetical protein DXG03_000441 [Asterophora parasitica]